MCNCQVLTNYCLGKVEDLEGYNESIRPFRLKTAAITIDVMQKWPQKGKSKINRRKILLEELKKTEGSVEAIAEMLGCKRASHSSPDLLNNLVVRRSVYGDICQNESISSLQGIVTASGNDMEMATEIMHLRPAFNGHRKFAPPSFFEDAENIVTPPPIDLVSGSKTR